MNWHYIRSAINAVITINDNPTSENIVQKFQEYFNDIELLPGKLKVKNTELWPVCCEIFQVSILLMYITLIGTQTSFECCRDEFLSRLVGAPFYSSSEKTKDEKGNDAIHFERQKKLKDITSAFKILCDYSLPKLKQVDSSVVERVMLKKNCIITYFIIGVFP